MAAHNFSDFFKSFKFGLLSILGLSLVIAVHETGHFFFCKIFSIDTPKFSIGFGPTLFEKKIGTTNFVIGALPFGGYVEIAGMRDREKKRLDQNSANLFFNKPYYQKFLVLIGGILFNLLFAYITFFLLFLTSKIENNNSSGYKSGVLSSIKQSYLYTIAMITNLQVLFKQKNLSGVGGPLAVIAMAATGAQQNFRTYFLILALISVNLGIINLLPLPILDGGQIVLYTIEAVMGKPIPNEIISVINASAWFLIILLLVILSFKDFRSIFGKR